MQLGLVEDDPSTGAAVAAVKRIADDHAEDRRGGRVGSAGARLGVQFAADDFRNQVRRNRQQVAVGGRASIGAGHRKRVAELARVRSLDRYERGQSRAKSTAVASNGAALTVSSPP